MLAFSNTHQINIDHAPGPQRGHTGQNIGNSGSLSRGDTQMGAATASAFHTRDTQSIPAAPQVNFDQQQFNNDGILPDITTLRQAPAVSQAINQILATYEQQAKSEALQGKPQVRKSGRYNLTDTVINLPEMRWPNEGLSSSNGSKRVAYDNL